MFGYVRAVTSVLSPEDAQRYQGIYCGLCRTLGERYGRRAQMILNYDFVFLALLLAQPETERDFPLHTCPAKPWKKKACWTVNPALEAAADASVILTWWKLQDSIRDGNWKERAAGKTASLALKGHYERPRPSGRISTGRWKPVWRNSTSWRRPIPPPWTARRTPSPGSFRRRPPTRNLPPGPVL